MMNIKLENIDYKRDSKHILKKFNLTVYKGEKILLSGRSGSGKSTVFKLILGFEKPDSGTIYFNNHELTPSNIFKLRKNVAYVDQDVSLLSGKLKASLNEISELTQKNLLNDKFISYLKRFELEKSILEKDVSTLSGGERQRIGLIISLTLEREILLLDEIISSLDKTLKNKVLDYLVNSNNTIIATGHDQEWQDYDFREVKLGST